MIRRPPRSTPFPTRRSSDLCAHIGGHALKRGTWRKALMREEIVVGAARQRHDRRLLLQRRRSEEHTSELQSRLHLVCRLLLEKKKKSKTRNIPWNRPSA